MTQPGHGVPARRSSPGGNVVTGSLAALGYHQPASVALVETAAPRRGRFDVVLSQNAWNFISRREVRELFGLGYTPRRRALYLARRAVARLNTRRAGVNVALSDDMARLMSQQGLTPVVSRVTLPLELAQAPDTPGRPVEGVEGPFVVVPGTLTPYKDADHAIDLLEQLEPSRRPLLVLAGTDDGSGHQQRVLERLRASGVRHRLQPVDRDEMTWLLRHATATVIASRLESLSFSLAEALLLSRQVLASPLPVHREVAGRLGREPVWLARVADRSTAERLLDDRAPAPRTPTTPFVDEWHALVDLLLDRAGPS